jgi:uncharacterized membrane protein YhaH (DUF805 family)
MNYYIKVLQNYANFNGRARRSEFWFFILFNFLFAMAAFLLDTITGAGIFYILYVLAMFIPGLAVAVRRLHDIGKSGWMYLIVLIPLIGGIWLLVLFCTDSQPGDNEYGSNPKSMSTASADQSVLDS